MKTVETAEQERLQVKQENIIKMPLGLLGFEQIKKYVLLANPEEAPFMWLQMLDNTNQGFVVVPPSAVIPDYAPDISAQDVEFLGIRSAADALVLNIVTVRGGDATVNLKGPIVVNRSTLVAKQCIPVNVAAFSLQHALAAIPVAA
jgi:flagellar assembly factor FliW